MKYELTFNWTDGRRSKHPNLSWDDVLDLLGTNPPEVLSVWIEPVM